MQKYISFYPQHLKKSSQLRFLPQGVLPDIKTGVHIELRCSDVSIIFLLANKCYPWERVAKLWSPHKVNFNLNQCPLLWPFLRKQKNNILSKYGSNISQTILLNNLICIDLINGQLYRVLINQLFFVLWRVEINSECLTTYLAW